MASVEELIEQAMTEGLGAAIEQSMRGRIAFDVLIVEAPQAHGGRHAAGVDGARLGRESPRWQTYFRELMPVKRAALGARGVAVDTEVLGRGAERCAYFRDVVRPRGGRSSMIGYPRLGGVVLGGVIVGRTGGLFTEKDVRCMEALLGPMAMATAAMVGVAASRQRAPAQTLTAREAEIMGYVRLGYTNGQIGGLLGLSAFTVRNHLSAIFEKIGASNRAEATALWQAP